MSTDSTELTFVRCPSCRSLVPASQTRCRMCGASLDASGKAEEGDKSIDNKAPRVKQRTMSQPKGELAAALGQLREEHSESAAPAASKISSAEHNLEQESDDLPADDPLSAYIEEVDSSPDAEAEDDFDSIEPQPTEVQAPVGAANGGPKAQAFTAPEPAPKVEPPKQEARVVVESGRRPSSSGLSFSKGREQRVETKPAPKVEEQVAKAPQPRVEEPRAAKPAPKEVQQQARTHTPPKIAKPGAKGMLYGWLVNYSDPDGSATELREGKFFITASSLKPNDLVLDHPSVSTPHAMVSISTDSGFQMQDLMSERGLFVRRKNSDSYQSEDTAHIEHGDWIKIGEVEFLVSLIAHVGVK